MIIGNKPPEEPFHLRICYHRCIDILNYLNEDLIWQLESCDWGTIKTPKREHIYIERGCYHEDLKTKSNAFSLV